MKCGIAIVDKNTATRCNMYESHKHHGATRQAALICVDKLVVIFGEESKVSDWEEACGSLCLCCPSYINLSDLYMGVFNLYKFIRVYIYVLCIFLLYYILIKLFAGKKKSVSNRLLQIGIQAFPSWVVTYFSRPSLLHPSSIMGWGFAQVSCFHQNRLVNQAETSTWPSCLSFSSFQKQNPLKFQLDT